MRVAAKRTDGGFTLVELLVVLAIMMVVAAMATPNMLTAVANYRLKSSASGLAGLLQQSRITAVRMNNRIALRWDTVNSRQRVYIDVPTGLPPAANGTYDAGEPMMVFTKNVSLVTTGFPGDASTGLGYTVQTLGSNPRFSPRGLPCVMLTSGGSGTPSVCKTLDSSGVAVGFVLYMKSDNVFGSTGWAALTITPGGRIKSWMYQGNKWQ